MRTLTTLLIAFLSVAVTAQDLNWAYSFTYPNSVRETALGMSSNGKDRIAVAVKGSKNVLVDLRYEDADSKAGDSYIAVYNKDATLLWTVNGVGRSSIAQRMENIHMTSDGSVYALGRYGGTEDFDPGSGKDEVQASNIGSMYVQKFDKDGNYQWVATTSFSGIPYESTERPNGNLIVAGDCHGDTTQKLKDGSEVQIVRGLFVIEVDPDGNIVNAGSVHAKPINSHYYDVDVDSEGNVVLSGCYEEAADFDLGAAEVWDTSYRSIDAFVAKYDKDLNYIWHRSFGDVKGNTPTWERAYGVEIGAGDDIFVAGIFSYETDFDPDNNPGKFILIADEMSQSPDGFILKYDKDAEVQWVQHLGGDLRVDQLNNDIQIWNLKKDDKHLYLSGFVTGAVDMDPGEDVYQFGVDGGTFAWAGQYDLDGELESVFMVEDTGTILQNMGVEEFVDIEIMEGSLVGFGRFQKVVDFDPGSGVYFLETDTNGSLHSFDNDIFLARWDYDTNTVSIATIEKDDMLVYPNPARYKINIQSPFTGTTQYAIRDAQGRLILSGASNDKNFSIITETQPMGVYFIELRSEGKMLVRKVVLE